jgi:hypothetical protein
MLNALVSSVLILLHCYCYRLAGRVSEYFLGTYTRQHQTVTCPLLT